MTVKNVRREIDAETAEADAATAKEVMEPPPDVADPQPASLVQELII